MLYLINFFDKGLTMNSKSSNKSTGPVTPEGKAISSKNAMTKGIFAKGYLPGEDIGAQVALMQGLVQVWEADRHPERMTFIRDIEEADLRLSRAMQCERLQIEAQMQSLDIAREFAQLAGMSSSAFLSLPSWFFQDDELGMQEKKWALYIDLVLSEAKHLRAHYADRLVPHIEQEYPNLFYHIMRGQKAGSSFLIVLGQRFAQSAPTLNLAKLINEIGEKYREHLVWAQDPQRYEILIRGIRARLEAQILSDEKTTRYLVNAQNRKIKANQALAALRQLAWQAEDRQRTVSTTSLPVQNLVSVSNNPIITIEQGGGNANDASFTVCA